MTPAARYGTWWLLPGETVAVFETADGTLELVFDYDDGTLWRFTLKRPKDSQQIFWDHDAMMDFSEREIPSDLRERVHETIRSMVGPHGGWIVTPEEKQLLDAIAAGLHDKEWISGRKLRKQMGMKQNRFESLKRRLKPRYLSEDSGDLGDYYSLTLPGLLACSEAKMAIRIIDATLRVLASKFDADPEFQTFTLDEILSEDEFATTERSLIINVVSISALSNGAQGRDIHGGCRTWCIPSDTEELVDCGAFNGLMARKVSQCSETTLYRTVSSGLCRS